MGGGGVIDPDFVQFCLRRSAPFVVCFVFLVFAQSLLMDSDDNDLLPVPATAPAALARPPPAAVLHLLVVLYFQFPLNFCSWILK